MGSWIFGGAGATAAQINYSQLRVQTALVGQAIPIGWGQNRIAPNLIWYGDFRNTGGSKGGKGGGGKGGGGAQPNYWASSIMAMCEGPISTIVGVFNSSGYTTSSGKGGKNSTTMLPNAAGEVSLASMGYALFDGDYAQTAWNYLVSAYPDQALGYRGTAYIAQANQNLGSSPELPMVNLDVLFGINNTSSVVPSSGTPSSKTGSGTATNAIINGTPDVNPADVAVDFLTNAHYGVPGWPAGIVGDAGTQRTSGTFSSNLLSTFWNYCQAYGLLISPVLSSAQTASDFLSQILKFANSEAIFSQGELKVVPYGDVSLSANGGTYAAPAQQLFDIDDDDLVAKDPDQCVEITRLDVTQQLNDIRVAYLNRGFDYNPDTPMEAKDDAAILNYGLRPNDVEQWDFVCLPNAAQNAAQLILQRQKIATTYKFSVDQSFIVLDPMDIVALYVPQQGLVGDGTDGQWVRIREIQENPDYTLTITAEIYLEGTGSAPEFGTQPNRSTSPNFGVQPGNVNTPILWEPTLELSGAMEVWCAVSGANVADWGGCSIWVSTDNITYTQVPGLQIGPARMGTLAANLAIYAGSEGAIDTGDTLAVNLTESGGQLASGSDGDAQALATLCYVDGEYIAYATASAFDTDEYNLSYLVRGAYGTSAIMNGTEHLTGSQFARLDSQIFQIPYNQNQIGQTLYVKFLSFNIVGSQSQTLDQVEPYTYTIKGLAGGIETISNFGATGVTADGSGGQQVPAIQCTWTPIENASILSVVFEYYVAGGNPNQATQISCNSPDAGIFLILAGLQPNTTYEIRATITTAPNGLLPSEWTSYIAVTTPNILVLISNSPPNVPTGLTLANVAKVQEDGTIIAGIAAAWSAVTSVNVSYYVVEFSINDGTTWTAFTTPGLAYELDNILVGTFVEVRVASVSNLGAQSAFSPVVSITVTGQTAAPSAPSGLVATAGLQTVLLQWVNPTNPDYDFTEIWRSTSDNLSAATEIGYTSASSFADAGLTSNARYYYWVRAVNSSGLKSAFNSPATSGTGVTTKQVQTPDIAPNVITGSLIAAGTITAENIAAATITGGKLAANTITNSLIAAGTILSTAIATGGIQSVNIANGAITAPAIAANAVAAGAIAAGAVTASALAADSVSADAIQAGAVTTNALAAGSVVADTIGAGAVTAGAIAANAIDATDIIVDNIIITGQLTANSVSVPCGGQVYPNLSGPISLISMDTVILINFVFNAPAGSTVSVIASCGFGLSSNSSSGGHYRGVLSLDYQVLGDNNSNEVQSGFTMTGVATFTAVGYPETHTLYVYWGADTGITLGEVNAWALTILR